MIALIISCDAPGCERHLVVPQHELRPIAAVSTGQDRAAIMLPLQEHTLGGGWAVGGDPGRVEVLCASHAPGAAFR